MYLSRHLRTCVLGSVITLWISACQDEAGEREADVAPTAAAESDVAVADSADEVAIAETGPEAGETEEIAAATTSETAQPALVGHYASTSVEAFESGYCAPIAQVVCDAAEACGCAEGTQVPDCLARMTARCMNTYGFQASVLGLAWERVDACFATLERAASECGIPYGGSLFAPCRELLGEAVPLGGSCERVHRWCADGAGECDYQKRCVPVAQEGEACLSRMCASHLVCRDGTCRGPSQVGDACPIDAACGDGLACIAGHCVEVAQAGSACAANADCAAGTRCDDGVCMAGLATCSDANACTDGAACNGPRYGMCVPYVTAGGACAVQLSGASMCEAGLYCQAEVCQPVPSAGEPCGDLSRCDDTTYCNAAGLCEALPGAGLPCVRFVARRCAEGLECGPDDLCQPLLAEGGDCLTHACAAGLTCQFMENGTKECHPPRTAGEPCYDVGNACDGATYCDVSVHLCEPRVGRDAACDPVAGDCQAGLRCEAAGDVPTCQPIPAVGERCRPSNDGQACGAGAFCREGFMDPGVCEPALCRGYVQYGIP